MHTRMRAWRSWGAFIGLGLLAAGSLLSPWARAQTVSPTDEYRKLITAGQKIQPLGTHPFGESVNLYNGSLSFEVTDVSILGKGPTLELGRILTTAEGAPEGSALNRDFPFGDWDLAIPRIETETAYQFNVTGWDVMSAGQTGYLNRCTQFHAPPPVNSQPGGDPWGADQWWHGYHLIVPGEGDQLLLLGAAHAPNDSYVAGTKQDWLVTCGVTANDGGEGFVVVAPDGTRYTFTHLVYRPMPGLTSPLGTAPLAVGVVQPMVADQNILTRRDAVMYVTKIEDRFGNSLSYNWSNNDPNDPVGNQLESITASDGRELDFTYVSGTPRIQTVKEVGAGGATARTWIYSYDTSYQPSLTSVQLPDNHAWAYSLSALEQATLSTNGASCPNDTPFAIVASPVTGSITTPSGLTATFTLTPMLHGRSYVYEYCTWPVGDPNDKYPEIPNVYAQFSLTQEVLSGPGIPTATWTWSYSPPNQSWYSDACASSNTCTATVYTDVTDPLGDAARYTFSNRFDATEGKLLRTDAYSGAVGSTLLRSVANTYVTYPYNQWPWPWPSIYGDDLQGYDNQAQVEKLLPLSSSVITQDGATFTSTVNTFDSYARAISETESSSLGYSKTDTTTYTDDTNLWVLGVVTQTATNGIVAAQTSYDNLDQPTTQSAFGRLVSTSAWNSDGTLASITDGGNHTTAFTNWYRGLPQTITFADNTSKSATVNGNGWITSVTDENGFTTSYAYDAMGRITQITYPTGEGWNPTLLSFAPVSGSEYGIPGGHWDQTIQTGNGYSVTYFDAYWRPLVTEHYDNLNKSATISQVVDRYDADGRAVFASYPINNLTSYTQSLHGTTTTYDALSRVTEVDQDSELGTLPTTTQYLSGFETKVIEPNQQGSGIGAVTSYMAYGEPTHDWPVSIAAPEGEQTTITRDVFGKPLQITRSGSGVQPLTRSDVYNAFQQLCKRIEPETGATAFAYDTAGNLAWSASGLNLPDTGNCDTSTAQSSGRVVTRTYDTRNRVTAVSYPSSDTFSNTTFGYANDGALTSQSMTNDGFPVTTTYAYDKRRLLTSETQSLPNTAPFTLTYGYDANGHLSTVAYPDGRSISYTPNELGQPTQAGSYATGVSYFPNGAIAAFTLGNDVVHTMTEDERGLPGHVTGKYGSTSFQDTTYDYDGNGNVAGITDGLSTTDNVDMTYDALDRLTEADSSRFGGNNQAKYSYDALDNLLSASLGSHGSYAYAYNASTRQLSALNDPSSGAAIVSYQYDAQGNLSQKNTQAFQFDMGDRLKAVPGVAAYRYDAAGRRVQKVETANGKTLDSDYSQAGQLMYQWDPANVNSTDYIYLGTTMVAQVLGNQSAVTGNIDHVPSASDPVVGGWACSTGITDPISVEIFAGQSGAGGVSLGTVTANQSSEQAVASACGTTGTNYRFTFALTQGMRSQYAGQAIYVYGDSPVGNGNNALNNSGSYTIPPNPTAPPSPASINVPSSSSTGNITVSWSASSTATSYVLQQQLNGGGWTQAYSGSALSTNLSGLANGSYVYQVQACNSVGCSAFTTSATLTVAIIPAAPASITVPSSSYSPSIVVSWSSSANASNYVLEESENGGSWGVVHSADVTSYTVTVSESGTYRFQVSACGAGGCSGFTTSGNVAVTLPPGSAPSLAGPSSSTSGTYTLSWNTVSGATRYQLNQRINGGSASAVYNAGGTSWASSGLGNGSYAYNVYACNAAGCSAASNTVTVSVLHIPAAPGSVTAPSSVPYPGNSWTVSWSAATGASSYTMQRTNTGTGAVTTLYTGSGTSASDYTVPGTYRYAAKACNASGCSGWTNASHTTNVFCTNGPMVRGVQPNIIKCGGGMAVQSASSAGGAP